MDSLGASVWRTLSINSSKSLESMKSSSDSSRGRLDVSLSFISFGAGCVVVDGAASLVVKLSGHNFVFSVSSSSVAQKKDSLAV